MIASDRPATSRLGLIAFFAGALWAQIYGLHRDLERERQLRERDARDGIHVLQRARAALDNANDRIAELEDPTPPPDELTLRPPAEPAGD